MPTSRENQHSVLTSALIDSCCHDQHNHVVKVLGGHDQSLTVAVLRVPVQGAWLPCKPSCSQLLSRLTANQVIGCDSRSEQLSLARHPCP